jgi:hypothetical protein
MSKPHDRALPLAVALLLGTSVSGHAIAAEALASELARCAGMTKADTRLACYDAVAGRGNNGPATAAERAGAMAAPAAITAPKPSTPPPEPTAAPENFGLSSAQLHSAPPGPQSIQAHVAQIIVDPVRRNYVVLDNGQTWASIDGELNLNKGELVTIRRAALGSYMLQSSASKLAYHVRRLH